MKDKDNSLAADDIPITKKDLKLYLKIGIVVLAVYGYANYQAALVAARQALKDTAATIAANRIQQLESEATTNAAIVANHARACEQGEYLIALRRSAAVLTDLAYINKMDILNYYEALTKAPIYPPLTNASNHLSYATRTHVEATRFSDFVRNIGMTRPKQ